LLSESPYEHDPLAEELRERLAEYRLRLSGSPRTSLRSTLG